MKVKEELRKILRKWKRRERKYFKGMITEKQDKFSSNRYEGISTGTRWCKEDLLKLLEMEPEKGPKKISSEKKSKVHLNEIN